MVMGAGKFQRFKKEMCHGINMSKVGGWQGVVPPKTLSVVLNLTGHDSRKLGWRELHPYC